MSPTFGYSEDDTLLPYCLSPEGRIGLLNAAVTPGLAKERQVFNRLHDGRKHRPISWQRAVVAFIAAIRIAKIARRRALAGDLGSAFEGFRQAKYPQLHNDQPYRTHPNPPLVLNDWRILSKSTAQLQKALYGARQQIQSWLRLGGHS